MNNENNFCKYCLDTDEENDQPLIYPCQCSHGIHANCLAIWLMVRPDVFRIKYSISKHSFR